MSHNEGGYVEATLRRRKSGRSCRCCFDNVAKQNSVNLHLARPLANKWGLLAVFRPTSLGPLLEVKDKGSAL